MTRRYRVTVSGGLPRSRVLELPSDMAEVEVDRECADAADAIREELEHVVEEVSGTGAAEAGSVCPIEGCGRSSIDGFYCGPCARAAAGMVVKRAKAAYARAEDLARRFHEAYERLAPEHGYETREASRKPWADVPEQNKLLMIAVCGELLDVVPNPTAPSFEARAEASTFVTRSQIERCIDPRIPEGCIGITQGNLIRVFRYDDGSCAEQPSLPRVEEHAVEAREGSE